MDAILSTLSGNSIVKLGTAIVTVLFVVPALLKLFVVTVDEGWAALRTRNGKPIVRRANSRSVRRGDHAAGDVVVLNPGSHAAFPLFWWYKLVDVRCRATDLPARQLTGAQGHQHLVQASFEWRPLATGRALRVFELDVVNPQERVANLVSATLRDVVREHGAHALPNNIDVGRTVLERCAIAARDACGIELVRVMITGDALTDGYLLSQAIRHNPDPAEPAIAALHALN